MRKQPYNPDRALAAIRNAAEQIADEADRGPSADADYIADQGRELVRLVQSLDKWITRGGRMPADWRTGQ